MGLDAVEENAKKQRLPIVPEMGRDSNTARRGRQEIRVGAQRIRSCRQQIQPAVLLKRLGYADPLPVARRVGSLAAPSQCLSIGCSLAGADQRCALLHQVAIRGARAVPFEHREFRVVCRAPLAVAKDMSELPDPRHPGNEQLFHREFRRGVEVAQGGLSSLWVVKLGGERPQMRFETRVHLQSRRVDLDEAAIGEKAANGSEDASPLIEHRAAQCEAVGPPPFLHIPALVLAGAPTYVRVYDTSRAPPEILPMKINAIDIKPGNVLEHQNKLWLVLKRELVQPGKGGAFAQVELRDLRGGSKLNERFRTQETVERVRLDEKEMQFLFMDGDLATFMDNDTFEQIPIARETIGDPADFLSEGMVCQVMLHEGSALSVELPPNVVVEVVEADPVVRGQTASSSYKPGKLENGRRVMIPPHIGPGTRIVVSTADGSYLERAKD